MRIKLKKASPGGGKKRKRPSEGGERSAASPPPAAAAARPVDDASSESSCDENEVQAMRKAIASRRKPGANTDDKISALDAAEVQKRRELKAEKKKARKLLRADEAGGKAGRGRNFTVSIALPGSILGNAQSRELQTYLAGQIARAAAIFCIDEVVVFNDGLDVQERGKGGGKGGGSGAQNNEFLARILEYLETPQYLRKFLFPMHRDLRFVGLLNPLATPHHPGREEWCEYREGVVADKSPPSGSGCLVNVGLRKEVRIDRAIKPNVRLTVCMGDCPGGKPGFWDPFWAKQAKQAKAKQASASSRQTPCVVSPSEPREAAGLYWGYSTRLASGGLSSVLSEEECPFEGGYDLKVGTSERGTVSVDDGAFSLPSFKHMIIVFGGVEGLEACVDADESLTIPGAEASTLFDMWVNTCPTQGSRTIRSEEALLVSLAAFRSHVVHNKAPLQAPQQPPSAPADGL